jgi:hypothetical protein
MENNRRQFLTGIGTAAAAAVSAQAFITQTASAGPSADPNFERGIASKRNLYLELDEDPAGRVFSAIGGDPVGTVLEEAPNVDGIVKKQLKGVTYTGLELQFATGGRANLYKLISLFVGRNPQVVDGAILFTEVDLDVILRREFTGAVITEFEIPAFDGSDKQSSWFTLKLTPESTKNASGSGKHTDTTSAVAKAFRASDFRLTIDGLDTTKIERMTIKQPVLGIGERGELLLGPLLVPDLSFSIAESSAAKFYDFFEEFVIGGKNGDADERGGKLEVLNSNRQVILFTIGFFNLGIYKFEREKAGRVRVTMYCERMSFSAGSAATG